MDYAFVGFTQPGKLEDLSFESIRASRVGLIIGWKIYEKKTAGFPHLIRVNSPDQLFRMLEKDRLDVGLYEQYAGQFILRSKGMENVFQSGPPLAVKPMYLYVNRKHGARVEDMAHILKAIKADGTYDRIASTTLGKTP